MASSFVAQPHSLASSASNVARRDQRVCQRLARDAGKRSAIRCRAIQEDGTAEVATQSQTRRATLGGLAAAVGALSMSRPASALEVAEELKFGKFELFGKVEPFDHGKYLSDTEEFIKKARFLVVGEGLTDDVVEDYKKSADYWTDRYTNLHTGHPFSFQPAKRVWYILDSNFNWLQERPFDPDHTLYKKSLPIELADECLEALVEERNRYIERGVLTE